MPKYLFSCDQCSETFEKSYTIAEIKDIDTENLEVQCEICEESIAKRNFAAEVQTHNVFVERNKLKPLNVGQHATDDRKARAAKVDLAIMNEGWESKQEVLESKSMAEEEEKKRGLQPGSLTTGVKPIVTQADKEAAKKRWAAKKKESKEKRKKF